MQREDYAQKNFLKKIRKVFVNRNGNVVTLQSEMGKAAASPREGKGGQPHGRFFTIPLSLHGERVSEGRERGRSALLSLQRRSKSVPCIGD